MSAWNGIVAQMLSGPVVMARQGPKVVRGSLEWRVAHEVNRLGEATIGTIWYVLAVEEQRRKVAVRNAVNRLAEKGVLERRGHRMIRCTPTPLKQSVWAPAISL